MAEIIPFKDFSPKSSHTYLLDNSILLFAYAPIGNYGANVQLNITTFLTKAKSVSAGLATTSLVLSEFYNVVFKDYFQEWKEKPENAEKQKDLNKTQVLKKLYRPSPEFNDDVTSIKASINQIMKLADKYSDDFNSIDINSILNGCNHLDYNDSYFVELANRKQWIICTRDKDIVNSPKRKYPVVSFL
ncbi:hypothetical protein H8S90_10470 [Olivibacter sp. SDN3]|uniref:hypothetical protein n=1 Tax=Olivibacter sp. SDN3 TaxID=2764720 RepID=UPI0016511B3C|nr:hypothetical protein [Olivibacter sp. SDN3]QNL51958.1 hypothetical protein H8S90_10470 [Olivibacter sp. SDN3]